MVGRSGAVSVCVKVTPSDASNPSGTAGVSGTFTVNNIAYNEAPTATAATPAGVQTGNVQINYFLADVESDICSIAVLYSTNDGTSWQAATMGTAGNGLTGLSSSPAGTAHMFFWDSRADNVAPSGQVDTIRIRITPADFNAGIAGDTNSFSMDNSIANNPPTVNITGGPAEGSTVATTQVTFTWSGSDTDGSVIGYYYSFDHDPPDVWTTDTTVTSGTLSEASHTFRVVAMDDDSDLSTVASRTFTVSIPGTITADFSASTTSGTAPLTVDFTDLSTATNGIDTWSWDFGDSGTSTLRNPQHVYSGEGIFTVSLTVIGPDGSDTETKTNYITVTGGSTGETIYVDGTNGNDSWDGLSWGTAVENIQTGLNKASDNWTVLVADGTYTGTTNKNLDFAGMAIHLKSVGGAADCIIDCQNDGRGFYFASGETNQTIVEGFTVENGFSPSDHGGGIYCNHHSSPTITNCIIANNTVTGGLRYGGGIYCNDGSCPVIASCKIIGNSASSRGGGISCHGSSSNPVITNSLIAHNSSADGGGILCFAASPTISNCTIAGNSASGGGGIRGFNAPSAECHPTINNTIVWGNTATGGNEIIGPGFTLNYCNFANGPDDVEFFGSETLNNCMNVNPLYVNATAQDYHLQSGSPCIDAGDNSLVPPGVTTDLDGTPRISCGTVDIGAYEYQEIPLWQTYTTEDFLASNMVRAIAIDSAGTKWFGTDDGMSRFDGTAWQTYTTADGLVDDFILAIAIDSAGVKWIGTSNGVSRFDDTSWQTYTEDNSGLVGGDFYAVAVDSAGVKWFGSYDGGVSSFDNTVWQAYTTLNSGLADNDVVGIAIDSAGVKWFATWGGGVSRFDGTTWQIYTTADGLADDFVHEIAIDSAGVKWFATENGLSRFDGTTWQTYTTADGLSDNDVYSIAIDSTGVKWFGTADGGVSRFDGTTWQTYTKLNSGLSNDRVYTVTIDSTGAKWFGTLGGVSKYVGP
jgi:PKD repeat protein